jgi:hypothetical protein
MAFYVLAVYVRHFSLLLGIERSEGKQARERESVITGADEELKFFKLNVAQWSGPQEIVFLIFLSSLANNAL